MTIIDAVVIGAGFAGLYMLHRARQLGLQELPLPRHFEQAAQNVTPDDIEGKMALGPDPQEHLEMIGKYVDADQVAAYEQYVYVPIDPDESDAATLQQLPGLTADEAADLVAARPFGSTETFLDRLSAYVDSTEWAEAEALPALVLNVFYRDSEDIYRTYFTTGRGVEMLGTVWAFLDLTPLGRQENWEQSPAGTPQTEPYKWWRLHDEYAAG